MQILRLAALTLPAILLASCASSGPSVSGDWESIGTISNGNIKVTLDKNSIKKNGVLATFRDKKVVSKMSEESFSNTPNYKTAIGEWEVHCTNKTYRLTALQLLDERGQTISNQKYTAVSVRPMSVMNGTIIEKQFETVCGKKL